MTMTDRDQFAMAAMAAMIGNTDKDHSNRGKAGLSTIPVYAYQWADAMLLARGEQQTNQSAAPADQTAEIERLRAEVEALTDALYRNGFRRCDLMACNCGSWHMVGGLRARMDEIVQALSDAGHPLSNANGNTPLKALGELVSEVEALQDRSAALDEWLDKTEWVRKSLMPLELGMHLADVMRGRIEALRSDAGRLHWLEQQSGHCGISVRDHDGTVLYGTGISDAIDAARAAQTGGQSENGR